jgi:hypothetical protein
MYKLINNFRYTLNAKSLFLVKRMSSGYLISDPKYAFLKDLQLAEVNDGVFNGRWFGDGQVCSYFLTPYFAIINVFFCFVLFLGDN